MISRGITGLGICTTFGAHVERMIPRGITGLGVCTTFGARVERMMPESWFTSCCYSSPSSHFSASNTRAGS